MQSLAEITAGVIFDEAHQAIARTYRYLTEQLLSYEPPLLGLTATPGRSAAIDDPDYELAEMFGTSKVTIDPRGHGNPVTYLIRQGYLADPEFVPVEITTQVQISQPREGFDYTSSDLRTLGDDSAWQAAIVDVTLSALRTHQRVLVFCPSVSSARNCARAVRNEGLRSEVVLGETPEEQRRASIENFRSDSHEPIALIQLRRPNSRLRCPANPVRRNRTADDLFGAVLADGRAGDAWSTFWRQSHLPDLHGCRYRSAGLRLGCRGVHELGGTMATGLGTQMSFDERALFLPSMTVQAMRDSRYRHPALSGRRIDRQFHRCPV